MEKLLSDREVYVHIIPHVLITCLTMWQLPCDLDMLNIHLRCHLDAPT